MTDRTDLPTRAELRERIAATLAEIEARKLAPTVDLLADEFIAMIEDAGERGLQTGVCICAGPDMGPVILADVRNTLTESDAEVARRLGLDRSTVSKTLRRVRRNLGLPIRKPSMARTPRAGGAA